MEFRSDGCEDLTGYAPSQLLGDRDVTFGDLIHPDDLEVVWSDVTESRRMRDQLGLAHRLEAIGRLAVGVAHDFNNMLTGISGFAELALKKAADDDPIAADLQRIAVVAAVLEQAVHAHGTGAARTPGARQRAQRVRDS